MKKILIIDDDDIFRTMVHQLLQRSGYEVFTAEDGKQGFTLFQEKAPHLIVTDIVMPEQEGIETIRAIRASNATLPIIAVSGGGRLHPDSYLPLAKAMGAQKTFSKPFDNLEFLDAVEELL